jgi:hypothetical protein
MFTNSYYYSLILVFSIICFIIVVDQNVSDYTILIFKLIKINIERVFWIIKLHPKNPMLILQLNILNVLWRGG